MGVRSDHRARRDLRPTLEDRARQEPDVGLELDRRVDVGARRIDHRDTGAHPHAIDAPPQLGLGVGELHAVVDHDGLARILGLERDHLVARVAQDGDRVGEVVLATRVLRAQPAQRRSEEPPPEAVDRGVDLVDLALFGRGVGVFDDRRDAPVLAAHDAAETVGFRDGCSEDRGRRVLQAVLGREPGDRLRAHERRVAGKNEDVVLGVEVVEDGERHAHRVARAALHPLLDELHRHLGDELVVQRLRHPFRRVPDDHDDPLERQFGERVDDVQHHRPTTERMQHLRRPRPHPRALPGCEDYCAQGSVLPHRCCLIRAPSALGLGGEGSNLDSGLQRTLCCRYTTPETSSTIAAAAGATRGFW